MGIKAFSFNSQAKYRSGGHFKEKAGILVSLSLAKTLPSAGGTASLTSPSGAPVVGFHMRTISKRRSPFLPTCTASTSTIRPSACLKSCVSPSQGINLIWGTRMHMTPGPISGFALSSPFLRNKTGDRRWITDVKVLDLHDSIWGI